MSEDNVYTEVARWINRHRSDLHRVDTLEGVLANRQFWTTFDEEKAREIALNGIG